MHGHRYPRFFQNLLRAKDMVKTATTDLHLLITLEMTHREIGWILRDEYLPYNVIPLPTNLQPDYFLFVFIFYFEMCLQFSVIIHTSPPTPPNTTNQVMNGAKHVFCRGNRLSSLLEQNSPLPKKTKKKGPSTIIPKLARPLPACPFATTRRGIIFPVKQKE